MSIPDRKATVEMQAYAAAHLPRLKERADKWIGGLTAVTAVLTTAIVVKGAETFTDLKEFRLGEIHFPTEWLIVGLMVAAGILLAVSVLLAYSAAYGGPFSDRLLTVAKEQPGEGAWKRWTEAVTGEATKAQSWLGTAVVLTVIGTALLVLAFGFTWFTPTSKQTCLKTETGATVIIEGEAPTVIEGALEPIACT